MKSYLKKIAAWSALACILLPNTLFAYTAIQGQDQLRIDQNINDNLYAAGGKIDVTGNTSGDLVAAGWEITVTGNIGDNAIITGGNIETSGIISGDLMIAGWEVRIKSPVRGDIKAAGGNVTLENSASGDVNIAGGSIRIMKGMIIDRDLWVGGGSIVMNGTVQWKADIFAGALDLDGTIGRDANINIDGAKSLHLGPNAKIGGKLTYTSAERIPELEKIAVQGATYAGVSKFTHNKKDSEEAMYGFITAYMVYRFLFLLIVGGIILLLFRNFFGKSVTALRVSPGKSFLFGLLYFILTPIIALLCFITVIGIPLGFLSLAIYVFSFVFAKVLTLVVFSELINTKWSAKISKTWQRWGVFFLVALLLAVLSGIDAIAILFAFGAILITIGKSFSKDSAEIR